MLLFSLVSPSFVSFPHLFYGFGILAYMCDLESRLINPSMVGMYFFSTSENACVFLKIIQL